MDLYCIAITFLEHLVPKLLREKADKECVIKEIIDSSTYAY
jgi:hypothetical protein